MWGSTFIVLTPEQTVVLRQIEPRANGLRAWLTDLMDGDVGEIEEAMADEQLRTEYLYDFLYDAHQVRVREDGVSEFWRACDPEVRQMLGDLPVVVYHHSSDALTETIRNKGLLGGMPDVNRDGLESLGVYVTTETSGPAIDGYMRRATAFHGGDAITFSVITTLPQLEPDMNDADITSGKTQFVLPYVSPDDILEFNPQAAAKYLPAVTHPSLPMAAMEATFEIPRSGELAVGISL